MEQIYRLYVNGGPSQDEALQNQIELNEIPDLRENFHLFVTFTNAESFPQSIVEIIRSTEYLIGFTFVDCPESIMIDGLNYLASSKIQELAILCSSLSLASFSAIVQVAADLRINSLNISSCALTNEHLVPFYSKLNRLNIEELGFSSNNLTDFNFEAVFSSLKLRCLDLSFNNFSQDIIDKIPPLIDSNKISLSDLSVFMLPCSPELNYSQVSASLDLQNVYCSPRNGYFVSFNDYSLYFDDENDNDDCEELHPMYYQRLLNPITFIYDPGLVERNKNIATSEWKSSMVTMSVANTIGEYWTIYNRMPPFNKLPERSYIGIFKGDSCPDWDRPEFADGHRAIVVANNPGGWPDVIALLNTIATQLASGNAPEALRGVVLENYTGNRAKFFAWFSKMDPIHKQDYNHYLQSLTPRSPKAWQWRFTDFADQRKVPRKGNFKRLPYQK